MQVFARGQDIDHDGLSPGFLPGTNHQGVVRGRAPRHRGMLVGTLDSVSMEGQAACAVLTCTRGTVVKKGDGLVFDGGTPDTEEQGGAVYDVRGEGPVTVVFGRGQVDVKQLTVRMWQCYLLWLV